MESDHWEYKLLNWFDTYGRKLYWRTYELNHFQWLVLEILLRRSKAEKVNELCGYFFNKYKNPEDILKVSGSELSEDLKPIGYNKKRCAILKDVSLQLLSEYDGVVPLNFVDLCKIKHIGIYIASAFLCFRANDTEEPCIDTNVIRIISRFYGVNVKNDNRADTIIRAIVKNIVPQEYFKEFNYALLDLGGTVCKPVKPECNGCPINDKCYFKLQWGSD